MDKTITCQGRSVFYRDSGEGNPVVFVHGLAEDGAIWQIQADFLRSRFRVIIPDLPGSGKSEATDDMSMESLADSVKAILDAEQITSTTIIGHSMGGYVVLAFAEKYAETLQAFGLFHSTAFEDSEEKKASRQKNIQFIKTRGTYEYLKQSVPVLFGNDFKELHPEAVTNLIEQYKDFNPASLQAYNEAMMRRPDRSEILKKFVKPVLFIIGKKDNAIPFADSMRQCHLPALSYIHIFDKSGHMGMLEEAEKSNFVLNTFLQEVPGHA
jgi:pimeloyl-ACP methyl ester carboxylesterase